MEMMDEDDFEKLSHEVGREDRQESGEGFTLYAYF